MNFYRDASDILEKIENKKGTIKGLTLSDKVRDKKKMFAIICQTLKYKPIILELLEKISFNYKNQKINQNLALVLTHDMLFSSRGIVAPQGPIKDKITKYKPKLKELLAELRKERNVKSNKELIEDNSTAESIPRYIRVNTLKTNMDIVIKSFVKSGYELVEYDEEFDWSQKGLKVISKDPHVDNLLLLPPNSDLHDNRLFTSGAIILQDKASCFPAFILNPPENVHCIDACAAPGNKTSHLSMILNNTGKVFAFDKDNRRLQLLKKLTSKAGCKNINAQNLNFLDIDPNDPQYQYVEYILLDPSCSGSGIVNRFNHLTDSQESEDNQNERLDSLSGFQIKIILHAFQFPSVRKVTYSTCSVHMEENENVVSKVLENENHEFVLSEKQQVLPTWKRRGLPIEGLTKEQSAALVRADPEQDGTNGFFVACFERDLPPIEIPVEEPKAVHSDSNSKKRKLPPVQQPQNNSNQKFKPKSGKKKRIGRPVTL